MPAYSDIPMVESGNYIQDYVEKVAGLDIKIGGEMKYALESALKKAKDDGYEQGFRDGSDGLAMVADTDDPFNESEG